MTMKNLFTAVIVAMFVVLSGTASFAKTMDTKTEHADTVKASTKEKVKVHKKQIKNKKTNEKAIDAAKTK